MFTYPLETLAVLNAITGLSTLSVILLVLAPFLR
jgi:hypothetical protein